MKGGNMVEMWFSEFHTPDVKHSIRVNRHLYSKQSDYQRIDIFETPEFGEVCRVDIYVDRNLIEIFVNDGEYVLSNAVCGLKDELGGSCFKKAQLFTLQE